jgi:pyridoxal phosphate enzyme (YggS family)
MVDEVDSEMLARNLADVRRRIAQACERAGRAPSDVRLVAVTKAASLEAIRALMRLGQIDLGENRPQQLAQRAANLPKEARWHLIGHLQRNKIDLVLPVVEAIHSVDSLRLLRSLATRGEQAGTHPRLFLEVNISGEASKGGFAPAELIAAWDEVQSLGGAQIIGLMTMAPLSSDANAIRPVFRGLRELRDRLVDRGGALPELSMGMSGDFEIAIEEGATIVRIGSRLFAEPGS